MDSSSSNNNNNNNNNSSSSGSSSYHPMRLIIYVRVTDIKGNPQRRHTTLAEAVCTRLLSRKFYAHPQPTGYDHVHIPADFDSAQPLKRWFIFDLNVRETLSLPDVMRLPHRVYLASRQEDEWIFIPRETWTPNAKLRTASYTWGGELEQKLVAEMRKQIMITEKLPARSHASTSSSPSS